MRPIPATPLLTEFQCQRDNRIEFHSIKLPPIRFSEAFVAAAANSNLLEHHILPSLNSFLAATRKGAAASP